MFSEFFADDNKQTRNGIDETMDSVGRDGDGARYDSDNDIEESEEKIGGNKVIARFYDDGTTRRGSNLRLFGQMLFCDSFD